MTEYTTETLFKVLDYGGTPNNGGHGKYHLPQHGRPGKWMPDVEWVGMCSRGYHLVTYAGLPAWVGPLLYTAEVNSDFGCLSERADIEKFPKLVARQVRLLKRVREWNFRTAHLAALTIAEHTVTTYRNGADWQASKFTMQQRDRGKLLRDDQVSDLCRLINILRQRVRKQPDAWEWEHRAQPRTRLMFWNFVDKHGLAGSREADAVNDAIGWNWYSVVKHTTVDVVEFASLTTEWGLRNEVPWDFSYQGSEQARTVYENVRWEAARLCGGILLDQLNNQPTSREVNDD